MVEWVLKIIKFPITETYTFTCKSRQPMMTNRKAYGIAACPKLRNLQNTGK